LEDLLNSLREDRAELLGKVLVTEIDAQGSVAYLTREAMKILRRVENLNE
jgi:hypothetical protein